MATSTSHYVKTVTLKDWWLTKADNNSLHNTVAVAGIESTGQQAARAFVSAPIVKRLGFCTLKTIDGVFVLLKGRINEERTCENGFSEEVFKYFFIGFPSNWENCAEKCLQQGIGSEATVDLNPDEPQEASADLQDDQNIDSVEERSFRDARSDAQNHDKERHAAVSVHDRDACVNDDIHDSNVGFREEVVRYSLRNRKVPYFEAKGACKGKHVKNLAKSKSLSKKTTISADISTIPSVASLENSQTPGMTPLCDESPKENAEHPNFAVRGGVTDDNHAENIAASRSISLSGEALSVDNSMHRIKKPQKSHKGDDMEPILEDASKANNLISRKRSEGTAQKNIISTISLLKKTGRSTDAVASTLVTALPVKGNLAKSGGVADEGINTENQNVRGEDESKQMLGHFGSASANTKKRSIYEASTLVETNTPRTCTSKAKSNSKAAAPGIEGKTSTGSTPKLRTRIKLDYAEKTTCTAEEENKTPSSQSLVIRTSRSGRLLLPTMEFWRNQLPIYDADHGISGIKEGSTILKLKRVVLAIFNEASLNPT